MIYLDEAATAQYKGFDDIVVETMQFAMRHYWKNPSSLYTPSVRRTIDECRENIANFINAEVNEIYFTSGASESNNWAIQGFVKQCLQDGNHPVVITSKIEHKSIVECVKNMREANYYFIDVDDRGFVKTEDLIFILEEAIKNRDRVLVSIQMANNEIGTINDIAYIAEIVHDHNGILHVDATQAFGHIPIDVEKLGIDMMSASGHKLSTVLKGIGFLYINKCINIHPLIYGSQEDGLRGGTENTFGIVGLSRAIEFCDISFENINILKEKRDYFIGLLLAKFGCRLNGDLNNRLPNNINVTFPQNITGESLLYMLDMAGIYISTGSACNSKSIVPSYVLKEIGLTDEEAMRTVRFTLPYDITIADINRVVDEINKCIKLSTM